MPFVNILLNIRCLKVEVYIFCSISAILSLSLALFLSSTSFFSCSMLLLYKAEVLRSIDLPMTPFREVALFPRFLELSLDLDFMPELSNVVYGRLAYVENCCLSTDLLLHVAGWLFLVWLLVLELSRGYIGFINIRSLLLFELFSWTRET